MYILHTSIQQGRPWVVAQAWSCKIWRLQLTLGAEDQGEIVRRGVHCGRPAASGVFQPLGHLEQASLDSCVQLPIKINVPSHKKREIKFLWIHCSSFYINSTVFLWSFGFWTLAAITRWGIYLPALTRVSLPLFLELPIGHVIFLPSVPLSLESTHWTRGAISYDLVQG